MASLSSNTAATTKENEAPAAAAEAPKLSGAERRARATKKPAGPGKQFLVKLRVCTRLKKECAHYRSDAKEREEKIAAEKAAGRDAYDVKQMEDVLQETYSMIPNANNRFNNALDELFSFLQEFGTDEEVVADTENLESAKSLLAENGLSLEEELDTDEYAAEEYAEGEIF
jgi:hypothetical protein